MKKLSLLLLLTSWSVFGQGIRIQNYPSATSANNGDSALGIVGGRTSLIPLWLIFSLGTNSIAQVSTNIAAYQAMVSTNGYGPISTNIAAYQAMLVTNGPIGSPIIQSTSTSNSLGIMSASSASLSGNVNVGGGVITNNGLVWIVTNNVLNTAYPNGSLGTRTDTGWLYILQAGVWTVE